MSVLGELASGDVHATAPDAAVADAAATMVSARVGSALVMTGSVLVGIITERDVLRAAASGRALGEEIVRNWMTPDPETAVGDTDVTEATETMLSRGFRHLPILAEGQVVGVVSLRDLLSAGIHRHA